MKIKEIRDLSSEELKQKNTELIDELFKLRMRHSSGGQLDSPARMGQIRKDVARIKSVLRERENRDGGAR
ncbi:MAG: 50S ribosomal protein L29 [Syntrophales bacterium]|jgi:large subunit ribosomal protein L29|nr:50S ribosomal protein L29 [Syntrophales bacterium]